MPTPIRLLVGLGNPGAKYENTRHNAGARLVERFVALTEQQVLRQDSKFHGCCAQLSLGDHVCHALLPTTYMNRSGLSVLAMATFYKIPPEAILIVHDELDLPVGVARLKQGGGHGGHNGLRDIIAQLHSPAFVRLRIGIAHPHDTRSVSDYVLTPFEAQEHAEMAAVEQRVLAVLPTVLSGQLSTAMQDLHKGI